MSNIQTEVNAIQKRIAKAISEIKEIPEDFLPHMVFVEEEKEGKPVYTQYSLMEIFADGSCTLLNMATNEKEERELTEINIDWLVTLWIWYNELTHPKSVQIPQKELCAFICPLSRFQRNTSDEEIIKAWENETNENLPVVKYTLDEFAELVNDEAFNDQEYWIRFIKY